MDAVFSTTRRHSSSLAVPPQPAAIRCAARIPSGVAALPSPSRLADTLADTAASVSASRLARGRMRRSRGRNRRASPRVRPPRSITVMTPDHRHSAPAMDSVSSTAADAPFMAAAVTAGSIPCTAPHTSAAVTISVHTRPIAMRCASSPAPAAGRIFPCAGRICAATAQYLWKRQGFWRRAVDRICKICHTETACQPHIWDN